METIENQRSHEQHYQPSVPAIKVRCPECLKLYSVAPNEITVRKPKFECISCSTRFWLPYPESIGQSEIIGFPLEWLEPATQPAPAPTAPTGTEPIFEPARAPSIASHQVVEKKEELRTFPCPKCHVANPVGKGECAACGVVFAKYEALQKDDLSVYAPPELKLAWEEVMRNYEDANIHHQFLRRCQQQDNLAYAGHKYRRLLEAVPSDLMAAKMKDAVMALGTVPLEQSKREVRRRVRRVPLFALVITLSLIVMFIGYLMPALRNLVGFGAAVMFLALAIRYYR